MNVGLYFGSFNPIHTGHLIIAQHMLTHHGLDEVRFVVTPHNPMKAAADLAPEADRLEMVRQTVADNARLHAEDVEFGLPRPNYTAHTMDFLVRRHPETTFRIIIGRTTCGPCSSGLDGRNSWTGTDFSSTPAPRARKSRPAWRGR